MPSVELGISNGGYGGDWQLDPVTADLLLVVDAPGNLTATTQRLTRLLFTTPRSFDLGTNQPLGAPDDICNPDYGAGLPSLVGELPTQAVQSLQRNLSAAIVSDPYVATSPTPIVTVTNDKSGYLIVVVS